MRKTILICSIIFFNNYFTHAQFWEPLNGPFGGWVTALDYHPAGILLAGTDHGVAVSFNNGETWNSDMDLPDVMIIDVCIADSATFMASSYGSFFISKDGGNSWTRDTSILGNSTVYSIKALSNGAVFAGTTEAVFRSTDKGAHWTNTSFGFFNSTVFSIEIDSNKNVFAGTYEGIYKSTDDGLVWNRIGTEAINQVVWTIAICPTGTILAGSNYKLFRSSDYGESWETDSTEFKNVTISQIAVDSANFILLQTSFNTYISGNDGKDWTLSNTTPGFSSSVIGFANNIIVGGNGIYRSTDSGISWIPINNGLRKYSINNISIISDESIFAFEKLGSVFSSSDFGLNWKEEEAEIFKSGLSSYSISEVKPGLLFLGSHNKIFRSTDKGIHWDTLKNGPPSKKFDSDLSGAVYASGSYGIYKSSNNGDEWINLTSGIHPGAYKTDLVIDINNFLFISVYSLIFEDRYEYNLYRSTDSGDTWEKINNNLGPALSGRSVESITTSPNGNLYIIVSSYSESFVYYSPDKGDNWIKLPFDSTAGARQVITNSDGEIIVCGNKVYSSGDQGISWDTLTGGILYENISEISLSNSGYLFACTPNGIYRSINPTTSVDNFSSLIPSSVTLFPNYPNPFNPSTTIKFSLPSRDDVELKIYNSLGQEICMLLNSNLAGGMHEIRWIASGIPSGVYFYRLKTSKYSETKKLIFLK